MLSRYPPRWSRAPPPSHKPSPSVPSSISCLLHLPDPTLILRLLRESTGPQTPSTPRQTPASWPPNQVSPARSGAQRPAPPGPAFLPLIQTQQTPAPHRPPPEPPCCCSSRPCPRRPGPYSLLSPRPSPTWLYISIRKGIHLGFQTPPLLAILTSQTALHPHGSRGAFSARPRPSTAPKRCHSPSHINTLATAKSPSPAKTFRQHVCGPDPWQSRRSGSAQPDAPTLAPALPPRSTE